MKREILTIAFVALLGGVVNLRAQFTWVDDGDADRLVTTASNWSPGPGPTGTGGENVIFGNTPYTNAQVELTVSFSLNNLTFTNSASRPTYNFYGNGTNPTLLLTGGLIAGAGGNVRFHDINIALSAGSHSVDVNDSALIVTVDGVISDSSTASNITKTGAGTLSLLSANTFSGGITVNAGTLELNTSSAGGGTLAFSNGTRLRVLNAITLNNAITLSSGEVNFDDSTGGNPLTLAGAISGSGTMTFLLGGGADRTFSHNNPGWSGGLKVYGDNNIFVTADSGLGTGPLWFGSNSFAQVTFSTTTPSIGGLDGGYNDGDGSGTALILNQGTNLIINQNSDGTFDGEINGSGGIQKSGGASLTLNNYNSYSGSTLINGGTLVAGHDGALGNGTVTVTSSTLVISDVDLYNDVQVHSGGKLAGDGFASSATIGPGGIISPGLTCPIGTLSFNDLTLENGGLYEWNFKGPDSYDQISVFNDSTLQINSTAGGFTIKLISLDGSDNPGIATGFLPGQTYNFILFTTNGISGFNPTTSFSINTTNFFTDAGSAGTFTFGLVDGTDVMLSFTPVPEPSTWVLLGAGLGLAALARWRGRRG